MLATEILFSGTFSLRTPDKHIKSQQKSTLAKYEKNVSFLPLSFCLLDAMFLCILSGINHLTCFSKVFLKGELMLWFAYRIFSLRNITFTITTIITVSVTKFYFF